MASLTIRNLDELIKSKLRILAATHGRSMEDEVRYILGKVCAADPAGEEENLYSRIQRRFTEIKNVDLPQPEREPMREPPHLE